LEEHLEIRRKRTRANICQIRAAVLDRRWDWGIIVVQTARSSSTSAAIMRPDSIIEPRNCYAAIHAPS